MLDECAPKKKFYLKIVMLKYYCGFPYHHSFIITSIIF